MHILLVGSGGREHAFAHQLTNSRHCNKLFIMPGNAGTAKLGMNVPLDPLDFAMVGKFCIDNEISLVVVGPEEPLVKGLRDHFMADDNLKVIPFVGPSQAGAQMEGSKDWSKAFMQRHNIPTAAYQTFTFETIHNGIDYVKQHSLPVVLKADGLAAGKGVLICATHDEAVFELQAMLKDSKFGAAGKKVVVEEFLSGIELSVFVLTDGNSYKILPSAKDYKRIGEGDTGLNTGGMGAVSPVPFADAAFMQKVEERIIIPTINGLKTDQIEYVGFIFIGLMSVAGEPWVIEYNSRMGDPETEAVLPRITSDFVEMMTATGTTQLHEYELTVSDKSAVAVMLVSQGYPGSYETGKKITGLQANADTYIYHAGTKKAEGNNIVTNGGRVLAVSALGSSIPQALANAMAIAQQIEFDGKYYRTDIGYEFL